ncbi:MAG: ribonuclease H [Thaumarchaeota archaeon]|jgi:ribonuclease HI|nr:ribonuclease H [Nitrososphaerota archaeon]|tara:strand:+ start:18214 stop:18645 length:432 start_codon:yes stop_codon:yes gene_type:complete
MFFDGLCEPRNPGGVATYGFVLYKDNVYLHSEYGLAAEPWGDNATNNVAEYTGMLKGLEWLVDKNLKEDLEVFGDSQLVIQQMNGKYKLRAAKLRPLHSRAKELSSQFTSITFRWVQREDNREADRLCREAYKNYRQQVKPTG